MEISRRYEDMSRLGYLELVRQDDGDIIINVTTLNHNEYQSASAEFCTHAGGGQSPKVRLALSALMQAIEEENRDNPQDRTKG